MLMRVKKTETTIAVWRITTLNIEIINLSQSLQSSNKIMDLISLVKSK